MATLIFKIDVKQEDILQGRSGSCSHCPIALAAMRSIGADDLRVGFDRIFITDHVGEMPTEAKKFVDDFDQHVPVKPFSFYIQMEPRNLQGRAA